MPLYCTTDDLRTAQPEIRLVETTDDAHPNETGEFAETIAQEIIVLSCGIIDGFLEGRYALPLPVVPAILRSIAVSLTLHGLYERIGAAGEGSDMATRYKRAMDLLRLIGKGEVSLGLDKASSDAVETSSCRMVIVTESAAFTSRAMDSMGGDAFRRYE